MSYRLLIDTEQHCAFFRHWGQSDLTEVVESLNELRNHPDYRRGLHILRDLRDVDDVSLEEMTAIEDNEAAVQAIEQIAAFDHEHGACKLAVISGPGKKKEIAETLCGLIPPSPVVRQVFMDF